MADKPFSSRPVQDQETLDPADWESMRALGHRMIDDVIEYLSTTRDRPVWQAPSEQLDEFLQEPAPREPTDANDVYEQFVENIRPYALGNVHPRFWAWYMGNGTVLGAYAEMLTAMMNSNLGAGKHGPMMVEKQVIRWISDWLEFPSDSTGLLVSGGSMANLVGLVVARHAKAGYDFREEGYQFSEKSAAMRVYASSEVHSCNQKAVELMGMGSRSLVKIPVDENFCIDVAQLRATIEQDIADGFQPICVIASAGTVNTGAIDDLNAIAALCKSFDLWFHIDGAIGAVAMIADDIQPLLTGLELADSVALDLHKWLHIPFEAGCTIVRHGDIHKDAFSLVPEYLAKESSGVASGTDWFSEYGVQLSRGFRALKVWMSVKEHGSARLGRMMSKNLAQAHYLAGLVESAPKLELCAPVILDIVCFRWVEPGWDDGALNTLNKWVLVELQERGIAVPSYTTLHGRYCLRVAISNHRSVLTDFDLLIAETQRLAEEYLESRR